VWEAASTPLFPANAGTQMKCLDARYGLTNSLHRPPLSLMIWVPAFAGMSGWENRR